MDARTHRWTHRLPNEKSGCNKGKTFQSNMSKNTVDGNCMTKKMLIVMFSTNPAIGEKNIPMYKKGQ